MYSAHFLSTIFKMFYFCLHDTSYKFSKIWEKKEELSQGRLHGTINRIRFVAYNKPYNVNT